VLAILNTPSKNEERGGTASEVGSAGARAGVLSDAALSRACECDESVCAAGSVDAPLAYADLVPFFEVLHPIVVQQQFFNKHARRKGAAYFS
jgi:hypothetical protein